MHRTLLMLLGLSLVPACGAASVEPPAVAPQATTTDVDAGAAPAAPARTASTPSAAPSTTTAATTPAKSPSNACEAAGGMCLSETSPIMVACGAQKPSGCAAGEFCCVQGKASPKH